MRKFRKLALLMALVSSVFMVGCDASKIMEVITKVAEGIQKAAPAIKEVIDTVSGALNNNANAAENTNTNTDNNAETNKDDNANVTVNTAGDQEDLNGNDNTNTNTNTNTNADTNTDTGSASAAEAALANYKGGRLSPTEFKNLFGPVAREVSKKSGVPASIILAQAALETGWGSSAIGDAKNLFGIKGTGPAGTIRVPTREVINGRSVTINDNFRKYNTWMESLEDHSRLLQTSRYANCMRYKNDPDQFARELQKAGYATDPSYASKLISIMKSNNLYAYNN